MVERREHVPSQGALFFRPPRPPFPKTPLQNLRPPPETRVLPGLPPFTGRDIAGLSRGEVLKMVGKTENGLCTGGGATRVEGRRRLCPKCGSAKVWGNGRRRAGKQGWRCGDCGRAFVEARYGIPHEVRIIADRLIDEEVPAPAIASALRGWVSRRWVYDRRKRRKSGEV